MVAGELAVEGEAVAAGGPGDDDGGGVADIRHPHAVAGGRRGGGVVLGAEPGNAEAVGDEDVEDGVADVTALGQAELEGGRVLARGRELDIFQIAPIPVEDEFRFQVGLAGLVAAEQPAEFDDVVFDVLGVAQG